MYIAEWLDITGQLMIGIMAKERNLKIESIGKYGRIKMDDNAGIIGIITEAIKRWLQERQGLQSPMGLKRWAEKEDGLDEKGNFKKDWLVKTRAFVQERVDSGKKEMGDDSILSEIDTWLGTGQYFEEIGKKKELKPGDWGFEPY